MIDCLEYALGRSDIPILWHSNCYAQYTSKEESERLQRKFLEHPEECKKYNEAPASSYATRSQAEPVHWNKIMHTLPKGKPKGALISCGVSKISKQPRLITIGPSPSCGRLWSDFSGSKVPSGVCILSKTKSPARSESDLDVQWTGSSMQRRNVKLLTWHMPGKGILF